LGLECDLPLRPNGCEPDPVLDRDGQDQPAAVVWWLAEEVDPSRGPDAERGLIHRGRGLGHWAKSLARPTCAARRRTSPRGTIVSGAGGGHAPGIFSVRESPRAFS